MSDLHDIVKNRKGYKEVRENKYKSDSKDRLSKILKKKIQTTMIGALSSIEENFGFLWEGEEGSLNEQQKAMKELYNKVPFLPEIKTRKKKKGRPLTRQEQRQQVLRSLNNF